MDRSYLTYNRISGNKSAVSKNGWVKNESKSNNIKVNGDIKISTSTDRVDMACIRSWTCNDVKKLFHSLGLTDCDTMLKKNNTDGKALMIISKLYMKRILHMNSEERKKLGTAIEFATLLDGLNDTKCVLKFPFCQSKEVKGNYEPKCDGNLPYESKIKKHMKECNGIVNIPELNIDNKIYQKKSYQPKLEPEELNHHKNSHEVLENKNIKQPSVTMEVQKYIKCNVLIQTTPWNLRLPLEVLENQTAFENQVKLFKLAAKRQCEHEVELLKLALSKIEESKNMEEKTSNNLYIDQCPGCQQATGKCNCVF